MSQNKIIKINQFKIENFTIDDNIRVTKYGGKSIYTSYSKSPLRVQLEKLKAPFGVGKFVNPDNERDIKYSLDLTVTEEIAKSVQQMEEKIIDFAVKNSKEMFKKPLSREVIEANFKSSLKYSTTEDGEIDTRYQPRLKTKIYNKDEELQVTAYKSEKEGGKYPRIHISAGNADEYVGKGSEIESIVQMSPIWVVSGNFGVSWVLSQVKIYPNKNPLSGYAFEDSDGEDELEQRFEESEEASEQQEVQPRRTREKF